jgi:hypothetical protein
MWKHAKPTMFELTPPVKTRGVNIKCVDVIEGIPEMFICNSSSED